MITTVGPGKLVVHRPRGRQEDGQRARSLLSAAGVARALRQPNALPILAWLHLLPKVGFLVSYDHDPQTLKARISIVDAIEASGFHFSGRRLAKWRRCKEHDSLLVNTHTNSFFWWSQGYGGDVFDWIMRNTNCDFQTALERAAHGDYGVSVQLPPPDQPAFVQPDLPPDLHLRYHRALDPAARGWWKEQGADEEMVSRFFLGACDYHPIWMQPTYTIPVIVGGKLVNIRHRLANPPPTGDKYRPERAGLPTELFNSDILTADLAGVIIVAGEKKAIVLARFGLPAVSSTAGCGHWNDEWTTRLQFCRKVYIAFDPGEGEAAQRLAQRIGDRAFQVDLPGKPDDFLLRVAAKADVATAEQQFRTYLRCARPCVDADIWANRTGRNQWKKLRDLPR